MSDEIREITGEEAYELIKKIAGPTFKYMMKRVHNEILSDKKYTNVSVNSLISVLMTTLATIDSNLLIWIATVYKNSAKRDVDMNQLINGLILNVTEQVKHKAEEKIH